ncbi:MAG: hypothetical protein J2P41_21180, partial [Blastocatellia bacterium]|nr:hypothetical protein [Blastocatellia bacterium]
VSVYDARNLQDGAIAYKVATRSEVKEAAPLWLYVDLGKGPQKDLYSAARFAPGDESDPRSFGRVLDFDGPELHGPPDEVTINTDALSVLNILQGLFYAARLDNFQREVDTIHNPHNLKGTVSHDPVPLHNKASLVGAQITLSGKHDHQLKLETASGEDWLSVPLEVGVQYTVYIEFVPEQKDDEQHRPPQNHFYRFYDAIKPKSCIQYSISGQMETMAERCGPSDPPCTAMAMSRHDSLE